MFNKRAKAVRDEQARFALAVKLRDVAFFEGFDMVELERVAELADSVEAASGAVVIDQGAVGLECFVVLAGEGTVHVGDELVATVGPGSMIGEMALVGHRPRSASVIAASPMELVAFNTEDFAQLLAEMPKVHERVMATLGSRLAANAERRQD